MERILLKTIKFDLQVEHPYSFLLKYAKYFKGKQCFLGELRFSGGTLDYDSLHLHQRFSYPCLKLSFMNV